MPGFQNSGTGTVGHVRARSGTTNARGQARGHWFGHGPGTGMPGFQNSGTGTAGHTKIGFGRARARALPVPDQSLFCAVFDCPYQDFKCVVHWSQ